MKIHFLGFLFAFVLLASCSDDDEQVYTPMPTPAAAGFTWRENDPNGAVQTAPTATFSTQYKTMIVKDSNDATLFEINLNGTAAGTYTVGPDNAVTYTGINPFFVADTGEVIISSNANGKVSGTFEAFRGGSGLTRIYATFTDVTVVP